MRIFKNKRAVSPVVGVILMVAITIVLAATIYIWISSMSSPAATAPSINFRGTVVNASSDSTYEYYVNLTVISVQGSASWGDLIIKIYKNDTELSSDNYNIKLNGNSNIAGAVQAGDVLSIQLTNNVNSGDNIKVQIVHNPSNSIIYDNTFTLP